MKSLIFIFTITFCSMPVFASENACKAQFNISANVETLPNGNSVEVFSNIDASKFNETLGVLAEDERMGDSLQDLISSLEQQEYVFESAQLKCENCEQKKTITAYSLIGNFTKDGVAMRPQVKFDCIYSKSTNEAMTSITKLEMEYKLIVSPVHQN